jgi:hypothetical protein
MRIANMKRLFAVLLVAVASIAASQSAGAEARQEKAELSATIIATDFAYDIPDRLDAGYVTFTLQNEGAEDHHAQILKLKEGATVDGLLQSLAANASLVGGPAMTSPGQESSAIVRLDAGDYVAVCFVPSPDGELHVEKGMIKEFTVTGELQAEQPEADVTAALTDFSFDAPSEVPAGEQVWEVVNHGPQPHEIVFVKLEEDVTFDQFVQGLGTPAASGASTSNLHPGHGSTPDGGDEPRAVTSVGGVQALDIGATGWFVADLEPGTYAIVCHIPDLTTGKPHAALGMVEELTVTG